MQSAPPPLRGQPPGPPRGPQEVQQVRGARGLQVLPGPLPGGVADPRVGVELVHQEAEHLLVSVHGGQVERGEAAPRPHVDLQGDARLQHPVPKGQGSHAAINSGVGWMNQLSWGRWCGVGMVMGSWQCCCHGDGIS